MKPFGMTSTRLFAFSCLSLPWMFGCAGSSSEAPTADAPAGSNQVSPQTQVVAAATGSAAVKVIDGEGTAPAQTVAIFLDSLRRGDERAANAVLTAKAREEMAKTTYVLQPLGTPEGQYTIGRVGFPYPDSPTVALVECTWTEPPVGDEAQLSMDIVCEVHNEQEGWRISGFGVNLVGTDESLVLDFEDAVSLQATIAGASGQAPTQPSDQQTVPLAGQTPMGQLTSSPAQPALPPAGQLPMPEYPALGVPQNAIRPIGDGQVPQIAQPQFDGNVLR